MKTEQHIVELKELEQDILEETGNRDFARKQAYSFAIHYRGEIIDAVRYKKGLISQDDLQLSRNIRWTRYDKHSEKLASNMLKANRGPRPNHVEAHHIVPWNAVSKSGAAQRSRLRLAAWGIDIDHEANGVWLPKSSRFIPHEKFPLAKSHKKIHTNIYYLNVEFMLNETIAEGLGRQGIIETLRDIGEDLQNNEFPLHELIKDE